MRMTEPEPTPLLIQKRMALQRERATSIYWVVFSLIATGFLGVLIVTENGPWVYTISAVAFLGVAVYSVFRLRGARREIRAFEERHGADAGKQD